MDTTQVPATLSPETEDKDVVMFRESLNIFREAPEILKANKNSAMASKAGAARILQAVAAGGGRMTADLDEKAKAFLIKIGITLKAMKERREPFTQLAAALSKQFTGLEAELDLNSKTATDFTRIQGLRNDWAKFCIEEAERQRKEAERKAEIEKEKARMTGWIIQAIGNMLATYLYSRKQAWLDKFKQIILQDIDQATESLRTASSSFDRAKLGQIIRYQLPAFQLTEEEINTVRIKAHEDYDFDRWIEGFNTEMEELRQSLLDRIPALRQELEEAAAMARKLKELDDARIAAEKKRREEEETARIAEQRRQDEIAQANAAEKKRLEAEAAIAREKEEQERRKREEEERIEREKADAIRLEQEKQEAEKRERERQQALQIQREKEEADRKSRESAELAASSMIAGSLFDQATASSLVEDGPESRKGFEITVTHPAGWVEIFQFWFQRKGCKMAVDKMGTVKLESMKTFCEAAAKDTDKQKGERIDSKYLRYDLDVKAVNRKERKKEEEQA